MKIPSRSGSKVVQDSLLILSDEQKKILSSGIDINSNNLISIDFKKILNIKSKKSFSIRFINYIEPYVIGGETYTLFYTEIDHNLNKGDRIFIVGGNYDSDLIIQRNKFDKKADGYIVQYVDKTKVVLDISYTGDLPWNENPIDDFIKVYVASSQDEFDYFCQTTSNRGVSSIVGSSSVPYTSNRFSFVRSQGTIYGVIGTFSTNTFLYINGTFSTNGNYGVLGFSYSGTQSQIFSNSFLIFDGIIDGYFNDITSDVMGGSYSGYLAGGLTLTDAVTASQNITNIDRIKIINGSFEEGSTPFKNDFVYYYDTDDSEWKVDRSYMPSLITEQNFRNGRFRKGEHNQGLYGTTQKEIDYKGAEVKFTLGTILNTKWIEGDIESGYGNSTSYLTEFDEFGNPYIRVNANNNSGFGYNYIYNSSIKKSNIQNGNFIDSILGSYSTENVVYNKIKSQSTTYSVTTIGGIYTDSEILFSKVSGSTILNSDISNSEIQKSKSINSEFGKSYFQSSKYTSDKIIKIENYKKDRVYWYDDSTLKIFKIHKFYINEDKFEKLRILENFYFDGILLNGGAKRDLFNFFDDKFTIGSYNYSYDLINSQSFTFEKVTKKIIVQLSTKEDNKNLFLGTSSTLSLIGPNQDYGMPSIDLIIEDQGMGFLGETTNLIDLSRPVYLGILPYAGAGALNVKFIDDSIVGTTLFFGDDGFDIATYLNSLTGEPWVYDSGVNQLISLSSSTIQEILISTGFIFASCSVIPNVDSIMDISNAYIVDSDFKSGVFKDSEWITGNYINYNKDNSLYTNSSGYYLTSSVATSSGNPILTVSIKDKYRYYGFDEDDVVFLNGIYYDTTLNGGTNLVKFPDTYLVDGYTSSTPDRSIRLVDINGTSSVFYNVLSFTNSNYLITKNAENNYNYIHPVRFENSQIKSGIFRRAYFSGCDIYNDTFDTSDKLPSDFSNYRKLAISDIILNDNSNTIKSGLIRHSSIVSGSDIWRNGILLNSIWNGDSFSYSSYATGSSISNLSDISFGNGLIKESKWISGVFDNGTFFKNKSNQIGTSSVYSDILNAHYGKNFETRYSWIDGTFKSGTFELSNWEDGNFINGEFFNSIFMSGNALGGIFGKKNTPYSSTKALSGSFSNVIVLNSEFKTQDPTGNLSSSKSLDWYSGIFNSGIFGVKIDSSSYSLMGLNYGFNSNWYGGEFNGGEFTDISKWKDGKFNGGKFTSYFGYPFISSASYSTMTQSHFAWQGGEFNGGEFGNFQTGTNSTWFNGEFNGGIFSGRYWNNGVFSRGYFFGSATLSTTLPNIPKFVAGFASEFYGLWNDGFVTEIKDKFISDKKFYTKLEREFSKKKKTANVEMSNFLWESGTFSHNDAIISGSVWLDGEFQKGKFFESSFNPYVNYITDGDFSSLNTWNFNFSDEFGIGAQIDPVSGNLVWIGTSSTTIAYQNSGLETGESYTMTIRVDSNQNTEIRFGDWIDPINGNFNTTASWCLLNDSGSTVSMTTGYPGYMGFSGISTTGCYAVIPDILEVGRDYDLTFYSFNFSGLDVEFGSSDFTTGGIISPNLNASYSTTIISTNAKNTLSFTAEYPDLTLRFSGSGSGNINGIVITPNTILTASNSVTPQVYSFTFSAMGPDFGIEFTSIGTNTVSGASWPQGSSSVNVIEVVRGTSGFNLNDSCVWKNGVFDSSEFFISKWEDGRWAYGNAYGMIWKNGVAEYMNAYNVHWSGGLWRNGNWNGSPFNAENISLSQSTIAQGFATDIITNVSQYRQSIGDSEYQNIFINNAFTSSTIGGGEILADPDLDSGFVSMTFSGPSNDWKWEDNYARWNLLFNLWSPEVSKGGSLNSCIIAFATSSTQFNLPSQATDKLYASVGLSQNIFTSSTTQYDISIEYLCFYGPTNSIGSTPKIIFDIGVGWNGIDNSNGGTKYTITEEIPQIHLVNGTSSYRGQTNIKTANYTFTPVSISSVGDSKRLYIQRLATSTRSTTLHILRVSVIPREVEYDAQYNNATYSILGITPSYSDVLQLPNIEFIGGNSNSGSQISIQFGNGIFESGTFSSIWENGVWNEGLRYDRNIIYFDNMRLFSGTTKPISYQGGIANSGSNEKSFSQNTTFNSAYTEGNILFKPTTWIITIQKTIGIIGFENGSEYDQTNLPLGSIFKVGDRVAVGNIIGIDINNNRRFLKGYLTIVSITDDYMSLEINVNFPLRKIEKDSSNHLIYVTKNVWLNGAFLNGLFKGVWGNGLFKGYPFITRMIDTQWIDGRFDGGRFRGMTLSIVDPSESVTPYNSGLIQNFIFNDNDIIDTPYLHSYNSWIDVNYYTHSTVTIGKNNISFDEGGLFGDATLGFGSYSVGEYSQTNLYSFPTLDVLSSLSQIRNHFDENSMKYSLGDKYKEFISYFDDFSEFENYYNSDTFPGTLNLISDGFTWSQSPAFTNKLFTNGPATASLYSNTNNSNESELEIHFSISPVPSPVLGATAISNTTVLLDNLDSHYLSKQRYSYISLNIENPTFSAFSFDTIGVGFVNINLDAGVNNIGGISSLDLLSRRRRDIKDYFYNRRNLNMVITNLFGGTPSSFIFSSLKLVEIDMIPFFQLATYSGINQAISSPWQSTAPFIDYSDANFSLIDSINLSETVFETIPTNMTIGAGGVYSGDVSVNASIEGGRTQSGPVSGDPPGLGGG